MALQRFHDRVAVVTGGANGIGAAVCRRLYSEGAQVYIADTDIEGARRLAAELGSRAAAHQADLTEESDVAQLIQAAVQWGGKLDVMVNNAGRFIAGTADTFDEAGLDAIISLNIKGVAFGTKHAARAMQKNQLPGGAIVNLASDLSFVAEEGSFSYCMTKGAVAQMTRCSALDLGPHNIRVTAVCPGLIQTQMADQIASDIQQLGIDLADTTFSRAVIKRIGKPEEVAAAIAFLASDDASFCTGTLLLVDGGRTCF